MNSRSTTQTKATSSFSPIQTGILQRKCNSCGQHKIAGGACTNCQPKSGLQRKLTIGASNDPLELEADRIADRVLAAPTNTTISTAPPRIQRFIGQTAGQADVAPDSVDQVLASPGIPLETSLQEDMGQRFGHDFSHVRVHTGVEADRSAQDVNASAYTVGHNVVFSAGQFAPQTNEGHNNILGQERADTVKSELTSGDSALPVAIVHAGSLGKSNLAVETKGREARNRRVQIIPQLRNFSKLAVPEPSKPLPSLSSIGSGSSQEPTVGSGSLLLDSKKQIPDLKLPQQTWVQDALKKDPIVKSLPKWAQEKIIDAAKDGDEMLAEKIIDSLPLGDKKAAIQSIVKSILQMVKGKKFEVPIPPLHEIPPSTAPDFPKAPGEVIVPIPGLSGAF
jgi:Domain of unknown function (DUF4157)